MTRIKIGQIGVCHEHASGKMISLKLLPEVFEIVGIVDDRNTNAARHAGNDLQHYEGLKWMSEEELLDYPDLEAVVVETPNTDLVPTALRCMERNLPMHMDKPGGEDYVQFQRLINGCRERKLVFQMGYMFRANPAFQFCLDLVQKGWLGDIFEVQANMSHDYATGKDYLDYLGNFKGGIMFNLCCHHVDFVVKMLGRPQEVIPFLKSSLGVDDSIKNNCLAILGYPNATVTLRACNLEVRGIPHRRLKICGTNGTIELSPLERFDGMSLNLQMELREGKGEYAAGTHIVDFGVLRDRYELQMLELGKMVRGEIVNPYSYDHDLLVQEVVLAASGYTAWKG